MEIQPGRTPPREDVRVLDTKINASLDAIRKQLEAIKALSGRR